jgi:hypothetical protein
MVKVPVSIRELYYPAFQPNLLYSLAGIVGAVYNSAGADVLQLRADERSALAGLHVLEIDHLKELVLDFKDKTVSEVGS